MANIYVYLQRDISVLQSTRARTNHAFPLAMLSQYRNMQKLPIAFIVKSSWYLHVCVLCKVQAELKSRLKAMALLS